MSKTKSKTILRISFNSPVVLTFALICLGAYLLNILTGGKSNFLLFEVYRAPLTDPLTYIRMFAHVFGHASWSHLINNMTLLLVIGPLLEEKYGSKDLLIVTITTRNRAFYILPWYSIARRQRSGIRIHSSVFFCMYKGRLHTAHLHTCCSALYRRTGG